MSDGVRIILPGVLRELADGLGELITPVGGDAVPLRQILDAAVITRPQLGTRIRDETGAMRRLGGLDLLVGPGTVVHILPSIAVG